MERRALAFLCLVTWGRNRPGRIVTYRQCTEGMDGVQPFTAREKTAGECLRVLVGMGYVSGKRMQQQGSHAVIFYTVNIPKRLKANAEQGQERLSTQGTELKTARERPKRQPFTRGTFRPASECTQVQKSEVVTVLTRGTFRPAVYKEIKEEQNKEPLSLKKTVATGCAVQAAPANAGELAGKVLTGSAALRQVTGKAPKRATAKKEGSKAKGWKAQRKDGTGLVPSASAVNALWLELNDTHFPENGCMPLPLVSRRILVNFAQTWTTAHREGEFADFLAFVVSEWAQIGATRLAWMQNRPALPCYRLLIGSNSRRFFVEAWAQRSRFEARKAMTLEEQEIDGMMHDKGLSREAAERTVVARRKHAERGMDLRQETARLVAAREALNSAALDAAARKPTPAPGRAGVSTGTKWRDD